MFVDSSVWIDFYNGRLTPMTRHLLASLGTIDIIVGDLVVAEVLQGCRTNRQFVQAHEELTRLTVVDLGGLVPAIRAAHHYRTLRALGITVRKTIDCLIATRCIVEGWPLLYSDRDFDPFVAHLGLRSALAEVS